MSVKSAYEILPAIHNYNKLKQFCQEICKKLIFQTEIKNPKDLDDYLLIFDTFIKDKKYLEDVYINFKQSVLKALIGQETLYEPLTAVEIIELAQRLRWESEKHFEFEQVFLVK